MLRPPLAVWTVVSLRFVAKTIAIVEMEMWKLRHDPTELPARAVQPALWLLVFGQIFTRVPAIPTGGIRYLDFMAPGILAQSVLFIAIFYGIAIIWERDLGITHKFLASPTPLRGIGAGKALSAGIRGLSQAAIIYLLSLLLGVAIDGNPLRLLGVAATVVLGAAFFSTLSLIIACLVKTRERFMGMGQLMTMPLFFASNAIYPVSLMPPWLQVVARLNPLTYEVECAAGSDVVKGAAPTDWRRISASCWEQPPCWSRWCVAVPKGRRVRQQAVNVVDGYGAICAQPAAQ